MRGAAGLLARLVDTVHAFLLPSTAWCGAEKIAAQVVDILLAGRQRGDGPPSHNRLLRGRDLSKRAGNYRRARFMVIHSASATRTSRSTSARPHPAATNAADIPRTPTASRCREVARFLARHRRALTVRRTRAGAGEIRARPIHAAHCWSPRSCSPRRFGGQRRHCPIRFCRLIPATGALATPRPRIFSRPDCKALGKATVCVQSLSPPTR